MLKTFSGDSAEPYSQFRRYSPTIAGSVRSAVGFRPAAMEEDKAMIGPYGGKFPKTFEELADNKIKVLLVTIRQGSLPASPAASPK